MTFTKFYVARREQGFVLENYSSIKGDLLSLWKGSVCVFFWGLSVLLACFFFRELLLCVLPLLLLCGMDGYASKVRKISAKFELKKGGAAVDLWARFVTEFPEDQDQLYSAAANATTNFRGQSFKPIVSCYSGNPNVPINHPHGDASQFTERSANPRPSSLPIALRQGLGVALVTMSRPCKPVIINRYLGCECGRFVSSHEGPPGPLGARKGGPIWKLKGKTAGV